MTTTPPGQRLLMAAAIIVATAAGIVGAIMLIAPASTGRFFAWPLGPRALAALVGGFYVVSAPVFAYAGRRSAIEVRGLAAAVLAFTLPTLAGTYPASRPLRLRPTLRSGLGRVVRSQPWTSLRRCLPSRTQTTTSWFSSRTRSSSEAPFRSLRLTATSADRLGKADRARPPNAESSAYPTLAAGNF
jgi:predicted S18 family serine protease